MGYDLERFTCELSPTLKCPICRKIYENPVQVDCSGNDKDVQHIFCRACLIETFASSDRLKCPIDGKLFKRNTRRSLFLIPPQELFDTLSSLPIKCSFPGCMMSIKLGDLESHIEICQFNPNRHLNDLMDPNCIGNFLNQTNASQANQNQSWFMDIEPWNPDHDVTNSINHGSSSSMSSNIMGTPISGNSILPMTSNTHQTSMSMQSSPDYGRIDYLFSRIESKMDDRFNHIMKILNHDGTKSSKKFESLLQKQIDDLKKWKESTSVKFDEQLRKHMDSILKHLPTKEAPGPSKKQRNRHDSKKESDIPVTSEVMRKQMKELKNSLETHLDSKTSEMKESNDSTSERLTTEIQKIQQNIRKDLRKDQCELKKNLEKELATMRKELKKFSDPKSVDLKPFENLEKKIQQTNATIGNQIKEIKNTIKSHNIGLKNVVNQLKNISTQIETEFKQLAVIEEEKSDNQDTPIDQASGQGVKRRRRSSRLNPDSVCSDEDLVEYGPPKPRERRPTRVFGSESTPSNLIPLENQGDTDSKLSIPSEKNEVEVKENLNSPTTKAPTITDEIESSEKVTQIKDNSSTSDSSSTDKNDTPEQSNTQNSNGQESQLPVTATTISTTITTSTSISSSIPVSSTSTLTSVEPIKVSTTSISNNSNNNNSNIITIDSTKLAQSWCSSSGIKSNASTTTISLASPVAASVPLSSVLKPMSSGTSSKSKDTDLLAQIVNEVLFKDNMANNHAESTSVWPTNSGQRTTFVRPVTGRTSNLIQSGDLNRRVSDTILLAITRPVPGQQLRLGQSVTDTLVRPIVGTTFATSSPLTNPTYSTTRNSSVTIHSITPLPRELPKSPPPPPPPTPTLTIPKKPSEEEETLTPDKSGSGDKIDLKSVMSLLFNSEKAPDEKSHQPASTGIQPISDSKPLSKLEDTCTSKQEEEEKQKSPVQMAENSQDHSKPVDVTETSGDHNQTENDSENQNAQEPEILKDSLTDESNKQSEEPSVEQTMADVETPPGKLEDKTVQDLHPKEGILEAPKIIIKKGAIRKRRKKKKIVKKSVPKPKFIDEQLPLINTQPSEEIIQNNNEEEPCPGKQDDAKPLDQGDEIVIKDDKLQVRRKRGRPKGRKAIKKSPRSTIIRANNEVSSPVIPRVKRLVLVKAIADETNTSEAGVITRLRSGSKVITKKSSTIKRHNVRSIALKKYAKSSVKISQATSRSQSADFIEPIPRVKVISTGSNDFMIHNPTAPIVNHPDQSEAPCTDIAQHLDESSELIAKDTDVLGLAVKRKMPSRRGRKCKRRRKDKTLKSKAISNSGLLSSTQHNSLSLDPSVGSSLSKSVDENFSESKSSGEKERSQPISLDGKCSNMEDSLNFMSSIHKPIHDDHGDGSNDSTLIFSESSTRANSMSDEEDLSEFEMIQSHLNSIIDMIDAELQDELKGDDEPCQQQSLNLTDDTIKGLESG